MNLWKGFRQSFDQTLGISIDRGGAPLGAVFGAIFLRRPAEQVFKLFIVQR